MHRPAALSALAALALAACAAPPPAAPDPPRTFDAVVIPGCPAEEDGAPSLCLLSRALWGAIAWERGLARNLIASGAAAHSPYVEAEAMAQVMAALGVPPERIYLEPNALHSDENMYDSLQIARALGLRTVAVASQPGQADWGCVMMRGWGQPCATLPMDLDAVKMKHHARRAALDGLRAPPVGGWPGLDGIERERDRVMGRVGRPPSFLLYPFFAVLRNTGEPWIPHAPARPPIITWRDCLRSLPGCRAAAAATEWRRTATVER